MKIKSFIAVFAMMTVAVLGSGLSSCEKFMEDPEQAFKEAGVKLLTLSNYEAILTEAVSTGYIKESDVEVLREWRKNPAELGID